MEGGLDDQAVALVRSDEGIVPLKTLTPPDLGTLKKLFSDSREHTLDARQKSQTDIDYYDNKQWSSAEVLVLRKRKQPEIWINRIAPAVDGVLGVLEQGQVDPRAFPRSDADSDAAEVATDALRYAAERSRWKRTKQAACKDYLIAGTAAVIVEVDDEMDPLPRRIRWEEFFYDAHSRETDYSDARYMGCAKWMYADQVSELFGVDVDFDALTGSGGLNVLDEADEDKPNATSWSDRKRNRVLVVEMYRDAGGWKRCVFYGGGVLEYDDSPYLDERGRPQNPIVAQAAHVDRDNQRYGIVRAMRPIQDEINMRRSKALHEANSRQLRVSASDMIEVNVETARAEAVRPDGVIPAGYDTVNRSDVANAQFQLLAEAKSEIERMGPNPAVLGRQSADSSGRAQLVRQQAGLVELAPVLGGIEDMELRVTRQMWCRIRQFWTGTKMVRVTDDIGAPKFLTVNEPEIDELGRPVTEVVADPETGQPVMQQVTKNRPSEMDMDILIDATPDTANIQAEQFAELMTLIPIYGPQAFPLEVAIKASSLPKKRELLDALEALKQQAQPQPDPKADAAFAAELDEKAAKTEQARSVALLNVSRAAGYHDPSATPSQGAMNPMMAQPQPMPPEAQPGF